MKIKLLPGFTLVEILVAIGIIGTLSGVGIASYTNFSRNQLLDQTARQIIQELRLAQSMALNNQIQPGCDSLNDYLFDINFTFHMYQIFAQCDNGNYFVKGSTLPVNLVFSGFTQVKFKPLRAGPETTGGSTLTISGFSRQRVITVEAGGVISL